MASDVGQCFYLAMTLQQRKSEGPARTPVARKAIMSGCRKSMAMDPRTAVRTRMDAISYKFCSNTK